MSDEADAAREYDRLRAELAEFVLQALSEQIAAGQQAQLSQALVDAIDRRVDEAVAARLAAVEWPDPDAFAESVIAAAGGGRVPDAARRRSPIRREAEAPARRISGRMVMAGIAGIALVALATFLVLRGWSGPTNTVVMNAQTKQIETPPAPAENVPQPVANEAVPLPAPPANDPAPVQ